MRHNHEVDLLDAAQPTHEPNAVQPRIEDFDKVGKDNRHGAV